MSIKYSSNKCGTLSDKPCDLCSKCIEELDEIVFDYLKDALTPTELMKEEE